MSVGVGVSVRVAQVLCGHKMGGVVTIKLRNRREWNVVVGEGGHRTGGAAATGRIAGSTHIRLGWMVLDLSRMRVCSCRENSATRKGERK